MSEIARDQTELVARCEANLSSWVALFGSLGKARRDDPPGVDRAVAHVPLALFNSVVCARLAPEDADEAIWYVVADGKTRNVPLLWWVWPSSSRQI